MASAARKRRAGPATTSLKIPAQTKAAIAVAANEAGMTPHGYLICVIEEALERASRRREFIAEARSRLATHDRTGMGIPAEAVHEYMRARAAGENPRRPKPVKCRK